ncbi:MULTISPECIES: TRM11 family SAM-dependent methyltransferase [unclassified Saccharicrinis]|uniref:TRM11 family SAM-dependent methyltransferase n=1 Tax=unclassified Saccharicrinis TaxID=2646859 RepID=UPI003D3330E2
MKYLILQHPGHNRVYYSIADKLALAELKLASTRLSADCTNIDIVEIKNIRYLSIESDGTLTPKDLNLIARLSFVFAIFVLKHKDNEDYLIPIQRDEYEYLNNKISSLLKYPGKTNELFTKMMINVAMLSSDFTYGDKIKMLDPVAGKGTTLFEGTTYGFDTYGIEIEPKSVHEASIFFRKYLQTERVKHLMSKKQIYGSNKSDAVEIQKFEYATSKEQFKSRETIKTLGMVNGNSQNAFKYFKKELFNIIVGDLPYGIAHGNVKGKKTASKTRNPSHLLDECLPEWVKVLKKGGAIIVAWNSFIVNRQKLSETFTKHGLEVLSDSPYDEFEHMVDKSIKRDIVVARKR